ncbi:MAG: O-antigen ligase family protein [Nitrospirota bacterium]
MFKIMDVAVQYGIFAYIVIMFFTKGEGIKNILLYGSFILWLFSLRWRRLTDLWKEPIVVLFLIYVSACFLSVFTSVDPFFSLNAMRGVFLKGLVLFPVLSTSFNSEGKLKGLAIAFTFSVAILILAGYYSYFNKHIIEFKPDITFLHLWHNQFARYINSSLPFVFVIFIFLRRRSFKILLGILIILSILGLILSTSRGGYAALVSMTIIWLLFLTRGRKIDLKRQSVYFLCFLVIVSTLMLVTSPAVKQRLITRESIKQRLEVWIPAIEAIKSRPLFGWGFGPKMIRREEPYLHTDYRPPKRGAHNTFLMIAFTQGLVGLISYLSLLVYGAISCWRNARARDTRLFKSYVLIATLSVIVGNYLIHSLFELVSFTGLSIVLGIAVASKNIKSEDGEY